MPSTMSTRLRLAFLMVLLYIYIYIHTHTYVAVIISNFPCNVKIKLYLLLVKVENHLLCGSCNNHNTLLNVQLLDFYHTCFLYVQWFATACHYWCSLLVPARSLDCCVSFCCVGIIDCTLYFYTEQVSHMCVSMCSCEYMYPSYHYEDPLWMFIFIMHMLI